MNKSMKLAVAFAILSIGAVPDRAVEGYYTQSYQPHIQTAILQGREVTLRKSLGEFRLTYYSDCVADTGNTRGITKSGAHVQKNTTVAVDPKIIPLGTTLYIEGLGERIAQDTGSAIKGRAIDVYVPTHQEAIESGVKTAKVYIIKEEIK